VAYKTNYKEHVSEWKMGTIMFFRDVFAYRYKYKYNSEQFLLYRKVQIEIASMYCYKWKCKHETTVVLELKILN